MQMEIITAYGMINLSHHLKQWRELKDKEEANKPGYWIWKIKNI
jgi:hypothetical protein